MDKAWTSRSILQSGGVSDLLPKPGPGHDPVPLNGLERQVEGLGRFLQSEAGKEAPLHDRCGPGAHCGQSRQRLVERNKLIRRLLADQMLDCLERKRVLPRPRFCRFRERA